LLSYRGDPRLLGAGEFDFVFSKSVLVMIADPREFLATLAPVMRRDGELIAAENLAGGRLLNWVRRVRAWQRNTSFLNRFHGVNADFLATLETSFDVIGQKRIYGLVAALRAR